MRFFFLNVRVIHFFFSRVPIRNTRIKSGRKKLRIHLNNVDPTGCGSSKIMCIRLAADLVKLCGFDQLRI